MNKYFITLISFLGFGMLMYYLTISGNYPIAYIDGDLISQKSYGEYLVSAVHYYSEASKVENNGEEIKDFASYIPEIKRSILDKIISDSIIESKLQDMLGDDLNSMVNKKVEPAAQNDKFSQYVSSLYGISFERVKAIVLEPQARQEILEGRLSLQNLNFNDWISDSKKIANIHLFINGLKWDGSAVAFR
ncbi:MAG: hypothetical protein EXS49_00880 [Candidatus Pacebacteria bacterium]|nr:hypothetical protein [Candidatus Paceibacterota bacterium]